jgi:hypothetical protein
MPYCNQCGKEIEEDDSFCHACGATSAKGKKEGKQAPLYPPSPPPPAPGRPAVAPPTTAAPPPTIPPDKSSVQEMAEKRVKRRIDLFEHIGVYVVVNAFLVVVWALSGAGYPWFLWVMAGWGLGLAFHIMSYVVGSKGDSSRHRMVEREMEKIKQEQGPTEQQDDDMR